ncbi:hypothetical protein BLNAU_15519 [Blattamonas nauphoetae]|uniref:Uncharacterized protein n=1 Tax=Blattamonas nauphoetae TaxID=2049346 RepID=A0ABQ9XAI0_9EUKA|nr:hypothetical protein BLNAU_15519 [Blattamonas nauphoetae]
MSVALQTDEHILIRRIQNCGDAIMKSRLTCILAKGLLLRSRLAIQTGDLQRAKICLIQSKQHMELNDTAEVECEFMHALGKDSKAVSSLFDELKMVTASARTCFGRNWEQWIQGGQNLPILLNPVFYTLQSHLQQIQDYVIGFRWYLGILRGAHSIDMQQTDQSQWATMENDLLQLLNEGLSLQLRIAWRMGHQNRVAYFRRELNSTFEDDGDMKIQAMTTQFKSQEEQIEELNIDDMTKAFEYIYDTTRQYCHSMKAIVKNDSASQTPIPTIVQQDIRVNPQLIIDRISELIDACHQKLQKPGNEKIITRLFMVLLELSSFGTTNSILDADVGTVEEKETGLHEETGIEIGEDHKKRNRGFKTGRMQPDPPSKPDKSPSTDPSLSILPILHVD